MHTLPDLIAHRVDALAERRLYTYLEDGDTDERILTYGGLHSEASRIAASLSDIVAPGSRVLLLYPSGIDFITAFFGTMYAGAIAVPAYPPNPRLARESLGHLERIVADCNAEAVLTTSEILESMASLLSASPVLADLQWLASDRFDDLGASAWQVPELTPSNIAFLQYTSGSTSQPKGVMLTHGNLLANLAAITEAFYGEQRGCRIASWLPLYHDLGLIAGILLPIFLSGETVLMSPLHFMQRPVKWLRVIDRYKIHSSGAPNFAFDLCVRGVSEMAKDSLDLSSWKVACNCAEPVRAETIRRFSEAFARCGFEQKAFCPSYGLAESSLLVTGASPDIGPVMREIDHAVDGANTTGSVMRVSSGVAPSSTRIALVDPYSGQALPDGTEGEIWVQSPSIATGYWGNREATDASFAARVHNDEDSGAWLRTGDLGLRIEGELFVTGRIKDVMTIGGRQIYPQDVEDLVQSLDKRFKYGSGIAFGIATEDGEGLAIAQETSVLTADEQEFAVRRMRAAAYQQLHVQLHSIFLLKPGGIPKTFNGKLRRNACKMAIASGELPITYESRMGKTLEEMHEPS
ncbi:fatty acyl-AMP ligase [Noviherbaspirillum sp.]|jgi:acyl-CoA synthetase (AMP-forming)/AMP-acid ligase II|uniref:fatty acyl-AMP ligase n=1 Tax=Noviherbaspirillum sp. TaxID=1926288 RepID=UPI0025F21698|nr:fatty acyl-AMP ligase [Noviherbaspirillum sp.]